MTEKMWSSPTKPLVELLHDSDLLDQNIDNLPWIQESRRELESTLLSDRYKYSSQIPIIKKCLVDAFGIYSQYIRFVNRFILEIWNLVDLNHEFKHLGDNPNTEKVKDLKERFDASMSTLWEHFTEYGREMYDKLEAENQGKSLEEVMDIWITMEWKFFDLILQRVQYVESKNN